MSLIAATTTAQRPRRSGVSSTTATYPTGRKVTDADLASVNLERDAFHGEWNYRIRPTISPS